MEVKNIIKTKRLEKGYTMKELAKLVNVSEATISRWESGNIATMKQTKIALLANALGISPAILIPSTVHNVYSSTITLSPQEETHLKKYRQLDAGGKEEIDDLIDVKLAKLQRRAEEGALSCG